MAVLTVMLYALVVVVALLLIGLILIQPSKSGGLGATFGGVGESVFGGQAGSHLTKATVILTAVFFIFTLLLATLIGHGASKTDAIRGIDAALKKAEVATPVTAVPAVAAPAAVPVKQDAVPTGPGTDKR